MNAKKKRSKRALALIVGAGLAVSALAVGIGATLASPTPTSYRFTAPNSYSATELTEVMEFKDTEILSVSTSDTSLVNIEKKSNDVHITFQKLGPLTLSFNRGNYVSMLPIQVNNSTQIAGYDLLQNGEINKKATDSSFKIGDYVTTFVNPKGAADDVYQENAAAKSSISWTSSNETVATCTEAGDVKPLKKGVVILTGRFEDKWGLRHDLSLLLGVDTIVGNSDLADLLEGIQRAEIILNLSPNPYTQESLDDLQAAVNSAKIVLNQANPSTSDINSEIQKIESAIAGLVMENTGGNDELQDSLKNLSRLIAWAETLLRDKGNYTYSTVVALKNSVDTGKTVLNNSSSTKEQVDAAAVEIEVAIGNLVSILGLSEAIDLAKREIGKTSDYTAESLAALQTVTDAGKSVLSNDMATKTQVDAAEQAIRDAIAALVSSGGSVDPNSFAFVIDTSISPSNAAFGNFPQEVILQIPNEKFNNFGIDWGDGTQNYAFDTVTHVYTEAKEYTISLTDGQKSSIRFYDATTLMGETRLKRVLTPLLDADTQDMSSLFQGCENLTSIPADLFVNKTGVTAFNAVFRDCFSLTTIPARLFDQNTKVTAFISMFRGCTSLTTIPTGLFDKNTAVTSFSSVFSDCTSLTTIPTGLFDKNTAVTSFSSAFYGCTKLTAIPAGLFDKNIKLSSILPFVSTFAECTSLTAIPAGLFDKNTAVTSFLGTFADCTSLTAIPTGLFDKNTAVTTFSAIFSGCTSLTAIPTGLFDKNTKVTTFNYTFSNCNSLTSIPAGLFDKNTAVKKFSYAFSGCTGITGALPELWDDTATKFPALTNTVSCFEKCTNASNYASVPAAWR